MNELLKNYRQHIDTNQVNSHIQEIILKAEETYNPNRLKNIFNLIDLTSLNPTDSKKSITAFCSKVNNFRSVFPQMEDVAALCVYPNFVKLVNDSLILKHIKIAAVAGGFPSSQTFLTIKEKETELAILDGANEIDMVISIGEFLDRNYEILFSEVKALKKVVGDKHLKVILETGAIIDHHKIYTASILAMEAGADFIKTSTGKLQPAATIDAVYVMCLAIKDFYLKTDKKVGIKPAGGIANGKQAVQFYEVINNILGEQWLNNHLFRIGASSLANTLLTEIMLFDTKNEKIVYF